MLDPRTEDDSIKGSTTLIEKFFEDRFKVIKIILSEN